MVRKKSKVRIRYKQVPHLTQDTIWDSDNTQENITYKRAFPAGDHKAAIIRQENMTVKHETQITKRIHKRSTTLERSVKLLEGFNMFDGANLTLFSDVDQEK